MSRQDDNDAWETRSTSSAGSTRRHEMVPTTPVIRPGVDSTPVMTWGNVEATPQRLDQTPRSSSYGNTTPRHQAKSTAVKRLIKATIGTKAPKETPFGFDTKTLRAKKATEEMLRAMASPIIRPRTPGSTPRQPNPDQTPDRKVDIQKKT